MIDELKKSVKEFFDIGYDTLMCNVLPGDAETFYMHTLRYYFAQLIEEYNFW